MTTANKIAIRYEWIKIMPVLSDQQKPFIDVPVLVHPDEKGWKSLY